MEGEHERKETLVLDYWIPNHVDRTTSSVFRHTRKHLIEDNPDAKCEVCGVKEGLELHHRLEYCFANALDWDKVKKDFPDFDWKSFDPKDPFTFVDSQWNANVILCNAHHTGKNSGIHKLPHPIFIIQKYLKDDFVLVNTEQGV